VQIIFQDPYSSLNPRKRVAALIGEPYLVHHLGSRKQMLERVKQLLKEVGMREEHIYRYPHEFSGGQRQRIGIARALILNPKLVICDEPVSALDVSIQAQVLNLLQDLQKDHHLTYLFISHDLSVVEHVSNRIAVMYLGQVVELGKSGSLCNDPRHPYTEALLSATPVADPYFERKKIILEGDIPSPINPPQGCYFNTRCPKVMGLCRQESPSFVEIKPGHSVRCFLYQ
jgi:peptide/nickel transport system ATP-binding protein/oligopeptide transport system ATP-binding protein